MNRPKTTLFMLMSLDGKISTGSTDTMDFDRDLRNVAGVKEGRQQYYDLEQKTDLYSFNSGRVFAKVGANKGTMYKEKIPVTFILVDNKPHLEKSGIEHLLDKTAGLILATTNKNHPAKSFNSSKLTVMEYEGEIDFEDLFQKLKNEHGIASLTIQSGGSLNAVLIRKRLIDKVSVVVAPVLVGGKDTPTLVDGESLKTKSELDKLAPLKLLETYTLNDSYLHLIYEVA